MKVTARQLQKELRARKDPVRAATCAWFFKTGPGQYGEGDRFLGLTVPLTRAITKTYHDLGMTEIEALLESPWHEERLAAAIILSDQAKRTKDAALRKRIANFYIAHADRFNNWDLVDVSAEYCLGMHLADLSRGEQEKLIKKLTASPLLWKRRMAVVATFYFSRKNISDLALFAAQHVIDDSHDLMHKASGWMLREYGKRVSEAGLVKFLKQHAPDMPRTMLRYSIERLEPEMRTYFMKEGSRARVQA